MKKYSSYSCNAASRQQQRSQQTQPARQAVAAPANQQKHFINCVLSIYLSLRRSSLFLSFTFIFLLDSTSQLLSDYLSRSRVCISVCTLATKHQMQSNVNALWHVRIRRRTFLSMSLQCTVAVVAFFSFLFFFVFYFLGNKNSHTSLHYIIDGPTVVDRMQCNRTKQTQHTNEYDENENEEIKRKEKKSDSVYDTNTMRWFMSPCVLERWQWHASLPKSATIQKSETTTSMKFICTYECKTILNFATSHRSSRSRRKQERRAKTNAFHNVFNALLTSIDSPYT